MAQDENAVLKQRRSSRCACIVGIYCSGMVGETQQPSRKRKHSCLEGWQDRHPSETSNQGLGLLMGEHILDAEGRKQRQKKKAAGKGNKGRSSGVCKRQPNAKKNENTRMLSVPTHRQMQAV